MKKTFRRLLGICNENPILFVGLSTLTILLFCIASFNMADRYGKDRVLIDGIKQGLPTDSILKNYYIEQIE